MSQRDKWVRRFTVDETAKHKNGFTIYKITSVLFPIDSPEASTVVSVWKRYSDVQQLQKSMQALHAGLHLRGKFPSLPRYSFFKRFQKEVIEDRAKMIKVLLDFVAEHKLLFSSTDFVNFLQTGYPEPEDRSGSVINAIRSSLHLPIEEIPPLEYQTSDDDSRSPQHNARSQPENGNTPATIDETDLERISQIQEYRAAEVEIRNSPKPEQKVAHSNSFESINSLESISSDLCEDINKVTIDKVTPSVKSKLVLPDLINFDAPSTSKFEDYHTMPKNNDSDTTSLSSTIYTSTTSMNDSCSQMSSYSKRSAVSLSNVDSKTRTEDYVFEAGYLLNLAAKCEFSCEYQRAFDYYKSAIEKLLVGVQCDTDPRRRELVKGKTQKYLSYAEALYKKRLHEADKTLLPEQDTTRIAHSIPLSMLRRPYEELSQYKVLGVLASSVMLVLHKVEQTYYAMKVIQKVPHNLTEFDEFFLQNTQETRQPILPTNIPFMVSLQAYIESNNLIFLILSCAPGKKLFDYIKNYAKSIPNTPNREVNLENVFSEPKINDIDTRIDDIDIKINDIDVKIDKIDTPIDTIDNENNNEIDDKMSVNELVIHSQRLLLNVDKALNESIVSERDNDIKKSGCDKDSGINKTDKIKSPQLDKLSCNPTCVLPPSTVCTWAAEILVALESLHNAGVVCRDLNPNNILLGANGHVTLTYMYSYPGLDMCMTKLQTDEQTRMYVAPELYTVVYNVEGSDHLDRLCDYWSYGAVLYELLCGVPLSHYHRSVFTSHTILHTPEHVSVEVQSLLTQLLTYDPLERLGGGEQGIEEIKQHPYFKNIHWQQIYDSWMYPG